MTIARALCRGEEAFRAAGCDTPRLDACVLLAAQIQRDKAFLFAHGEDVLLPEQVAGYEDMLSQRLSGRPVSYILAWKEFYGLNFFVDDRVLVPRPDTEVLVDTALEILRKEPGIRRIHDVCTGTGCIPIAIACSSPGGGLEISASDISAPALEVFRVNCGNLLGWVPVHTCCDLLSGLDGPFDMITANPPYIKSADCRRMRDSGWPEPVLALDGGDDGLVIIRRLVAQAEISLAGRGWLLLEASPEQADSILRMLEDRGWDGYRAVRDLEGRARVIVGRRP
ncbi:MAG: peptide chain release factor N(5)-glutamine methyltransferase [Spirochaetales bacterium]|jgi:release factor glutamine methyltransferase|nr:peptide chain release factor N(5)-glutamine methyltransferase [Spirochaetales bacterium]